MHDFVNEHLERLHLIEFTQKVEHADPVEAYIIYLCFYSFFGLPSLEGSLFGCVSSGIVLFFARCRLFRLTHKTCSTLGAYKELR